jgi:hypothetical protein
MLHDLRSTPTDAQRLDTDRQANVDSSGATNAYALAMGAEGSDRNTGDRTKLFALFDRRDHYIFFASAAMMLLPLLGGYYFN